MGYAYLFTAILMLTVAPLMVFNMADFLGMDSGTTYDSPADVINIFNTGKAREDGTVWPLGQSAITDADVQECIDYHAWANDGGLSWWGYLWDDRYNDCTGIFLAVYYVPSTGEYNLSNQYWWGIGDPDPDEKSILSKIYALAELIIDYTFGLLFYLADNVIQSAKLLMADQPDGFGVHPIWVFAFYSIWMVIIIMFIIDTLKGSIPFT